MAQVRRDARMLLDGLRGRHPPPLVPRRSGARRYLAEERASQPEPRPQRDHRGDDRREPAGAGPHGSAVATVHVQLGGRVHAVIVQPDETILDATLAAGLPMPFSCTLGGCGACKVALRAGVVEMEEPNCLTPAERAAGHVLICVGRPLGPVTIEVDAG